MASTRVSNASAISRKASASVVARSCGQRQFLVGERRLDAPVLGGQPRRGVLQLALDTLAVEALGEETFLIEDEDTGKRRRPRPLLRGRGQRRAQARAKRRPQASRAPPKAGAAAQAPGAWAQNRVSTVKSKSRVMS
jgi:hypothetical protein